MKNPFKKYTILFSVISLLFIPSVLRACSYDTEFEDIRYIILNPNLASNKSWWTYFYTSKYHYMDGYVQGNQDELEIVNEWKNKFSLKSQATDIENYLFGELSKDELIKNPFYKEIQNNKQLSIYFSFAKECENVVFLHDLWEDYNRDSIIAVREELLGKGLTLTSKQADGFWKKKYAFQTLRLAYYQNDELIFNQLYNTHFGFGHEKTPVDWWATHYKSMMVQDVDSGNYLHAIVFSHSSNKMFASRQNFSSRDFKRLKLLARNNKDMADLYVLKAMINPSKALDDIKEIARLDKNHPLLTLLLIREMNKVEDWIGTNKYTYRSDLFNYTWGESTQKLANDYYYLRAFYKQVKSMEIPTENADLFQLIRANLALMNQDAANAKAYLSSVNSGDRQIIFQKNVLQIMLIAITENLQGDKTRNELGELLQYLLTNRDGQFEAQKISFSVMKFLEYNFREKGLNHYAGLLDYIAEEKFCQSCKLNSLEYSIVDYFQRQGTPADVEKVIALFEKKDKTKLDEFLLIPYPNDNYFKELLGTLYMRAGNTQQARDVYQQIPTEFWDGFDNMRYLDEDPFQAPETTHWQTYFNKFQIADSLLKLEKSAQSNPTDLIKLGHAWFNFSTAGNSWFMLDYAQSSYHEDLSTRISENAYKKSLGYYLEAWSRLKTREEQAEAAYGLASIYLNYGELSGARYGKWADEYEKYNNTDFYRQTNCMTTNEIQDASYRKSFFDTKSY